MADTRFKKGQIPWNKGTIGVVKANSGSFIKGQPASNKTVWIKKVCKCGKEFSVKPSLDRVKTCSRSCAVKGRISGYKGYVSSPETREKQRQAKLGIRGEAHWNWRGGSGTIRHQEMQRDEYKQWRKAVFERDGYACQHCSTKGKYVQADHIKTWAEYPELRYELSNGRTLCIDCHELTDTFPVRLRRRVLA